MQTTRVFRVDTSYVGYVCLRGSACPDCLPRVVPRVHGCIVRTCRGGPSREPKGSDFPPMTQPTLCVLSSPKVFSLRRVLTAVILLRGTNVCCVLVSTGLSSNKHAGIWLAFCAGRCSLCVVLTSNRPFYVPNGIRKYTQFCPDSSS